MTRIAVTGWRFYSNTARVYQILDAAVERLGLTVLVHGACPTGLDDIADRWAFDRGIPCERFPADWKKHRRTAGPIRNRAMAETKPHACLVFPGRDGTANMRAACVDCGVRVIDIA